MRMYLTEKEFDEVMSKMFEAVGVKFHSIKRSCKGDDWFTRHTWTEEQEREFGKWLKKYVMKKLGIPAKLAEKKVAMFLFNYGWKFSCSGKEKP